MIHCQPNLTFVIEPAEFHQCIELSMVDFQLENKGGPDQLLRRQRHQCVLIASVTGFSNGKPFVIQSDAQAVTVQFITSGFVQQAGFEQPGSAVLWLVTALHLEMPSPLAGYPLTKLALLPAMTLPTLLRPCNQAPFLNGTEVVFAYESSGDYCANVMVTGATPNTGIAILNGIPGAPGTQCLAQSANGMATAVDFRMQVPTTSWWPMRWAVRASGYPLPKQYRASILLCEGLCVTPSTVVSTPMDYLLLSSLTRV